MSRTNRFTLALLGLLAACPLAARGQGRERDPLNRLRPPPSLREQVRKARLILLAAAEPAKDEKGAGQPFQILEVLKTDPALGKTRTLFSRLHAYPPEPGTRWLFFCDVGKRQEILPHRVFSSSAGFVDYVKGLVRFVDDPARALAHCVRYLEHQNDELAADAVTELARAGDKQLRAAAQAVPSERVAGWLQDPKVHFHRYNLYGLLLGYCGDTRHAEVLQRMVADPKKRAEMNTHYLLAGYTLLRPHEGWSLLQRLLHDRSEPRRARASALRAVRFLWDERTDVLPRTDMLRAIMPLLDEIEFAEEILLALRRWQRWEMTDLVLGGWGKLPPEASAYRHAIVCFALCSPRPQAAAFVDRLRRTFPEVLEVAEVILRLERDLKTP